MTILLDIDIIISGGYERAFIGKGICFVLIEMLTGQGSIGGGLMLSSRNCHVIMFV